jgi:putative intracellular protease/amidase
MFQPQEMGETKASDLDGLIVPGGFGAVKNLSDFAVKGKEATVHPGVSVLLRTMVEAGKPVGAICIAPATVTKALAARSPEVTIGADEGTALAIEGMGGPPPGLHRGHDPRRREEQYRLNARLHARLGDQGGRRRDRKAGRKGP